MNTQDYTSLTQEQILKLLEQSQATNAQLLEVIEQLRSQLDKLQRMVFGQKTERHNKKQDKNKNKPEKTSSLKPKSNSNQANGRKKLPADLPRKVIKYDIPKEKQSCERCHNKIHCIGKEISEQLDIIPAKLYVIEHRRYKYACRCCANIMTASMPEQPIDKSLAGGGLLAETLTNKYQDHMPLYRQELRYKRMGYAIARSTLCDWVIACAQRLAPIVTSMQEDMLTQSPKIHTDDTTIPVLAKEKTHTGRLWVYIGGGGHAPPAIVYRYTKTRRGSEPKKVLENYRGYLQADAYAGYDQCYASGDIIEVACWAHARRKFVDALKLVELDEIAQAAIDQISMLYKIEQRASAMTDEQTYYYRKRHAKPLLKQFYKWLLLHANVALPKSPVGKAVNYSLNHWKALNNYLNSGVLSIDNNIAERAMKSVVIGRKNYLFAGSHDGATHAATIYSLIETCKALNINTFEYLTDVLKRLPTTLNSEIKSLIPYNWKPAGL